MAKLIPKFQKGGIAQQKYFKIQKEFTIWSEAEKFRSVFPSGSTYETG